MTQSRNAPVVLYHIVRVVGILQFAAVGKVVRIVCLPVMAAIGLDVIIVSHNGVLQPVVVKMAAASHIVGIVTMAKTTSRIVMNVIKYFARIAKSTK